MEKREVSSEIIDNILRLVAIGGFTAAMLIAPNSVQLFNKPIRKYFNKLDKKAQKRELMKFHRYMLRQNLISENYQHGLQLTKKAKKRLLKADINNLKIQTNTVWDNKWRLIFYDIPEKYKSGRDALSHKLRSLGCYQLQRSIWVHPYPCKKIVETIAAAYDIDKYVTYAETTYIANEQLLKSHFTSIKM